MKSIAIVIPAYKPDFLQDTLNSLKKQSCQEFSVYIGDDASPYDLFGIVDAFRNQLDLHYHRFQDNLGGTNLVGQWERCLQLAKDEEWVCLFSDDDLMQSKCVELFHQTDIPDSTNILHYDIDLINESNEVIQTCPPFPHIIDDADFFDLLFRRKLVARMPEFIFRRSFLNEHGFIPFDLAWRSDTATVLSAARTEGILTLSGTDCKVQWRVSSKNISGQNQLKKRKNLASIAFFNWVFDNGIPIKMSRFYLLKTIIFSLEYGSAWQFFLDGCVSVVHLKFAKWRRLLCFLFVIYRIPYYWVETRRS